MDGFFVAARDLADAELVRVAQREQFGTGLEGDRLLRSGHANLVAVVPNKTAADEIVRLLEQRRRVVGAKRIGSKRGQGQRVRMPGEPGMRFEVHITLEDRDRVPAEQRDGRAGVEAGPGRAHVTRIAGFGSKPPEAGQDGVAG